MLRTFVLALSTVLVPASNKPQTGPAPVPVQAIVTVEARGPHGAQVPVLQPGDVIAYEHHERLPVTGLTALPDLQLFVLVDDSSAWTLGSQLTDLRRFIEAQPATAAIGVGYMRNGTVAMEQEFSPDHARAAKALRAPLTWAEASPYLSLSDLIKRWPATAARRAVIMVTSGIDPLGGLGAMDPYLDAAIEDAQRGGIVAYALYTPAAGHSGHSAFRINWGQNHLAQLAEETGGEAYMIGFGPPASFAPYLDEIAAHLAHQYRVTFLMTPGVKGGLREVRFTTEVPNAELLAAPKVYVPSGR